MVRRVFVHEGTVSGTIKNLNPRGFGFIDAGGGGNFFFHARDCSQRDFDQLHVGQRVEFSAAIGPRGTVAKDVRAAG